MRRHETLDPAAALDDHVRAFFAGHNVRSTRLGRGPIERLIPGFSVYEAGPGARFAGWSYVSSGCWAATARAGHGLEFVLSARDDSTRHVEIMSMVAYYHAEKVSQRLDLGHTVPVGAPWMAGGNLDYLLVSRPYAYGPDLEMLAWQTGHARLLALIPITRAERDFKAAHGAEALERRLEAAAAEFTSPARPSVV